MARHSPTRRNRRTRRAIRWDSIDPPDIDPDLDPSLDPDLALDPEVDTDLDPTWKPAARDSRLPAWIPAPLQKLIRIGIRAAIVCFCLLVAIALFYFFLSFKHDLKDVVRMPERTLIFDVNGAELATLHGESRRLIGREEIPEFFVTALCAREDKRFFNHSGIDFLGLVRATMRNVSDRSFTQGASTLTMQLARNSFDLHERSIHRKLIEIAIAIRIEWKYSKDEILTSYVNRIYFGSGCHGIDQASRRYFGCPAADLNPNQCAMLAGIIRAPHACSPLRNLEGAVKQRDEVLARLVTEEKITPQRAEEIKHIPLNLRIGNGSRPGNAAMRAVRRHFEELLAQQEILRGGLRLRSTIHREIQILLETETSDLLKKLTDNPEVAAICINSRTGGIRGIVGGRDNESTTFNRALDARRDLGSIFTPFIYAAAAEREKQPQLDQPLRTGRDVGHSDLTRLATRMGFEGPFAPGDDLYRGGVSATPLEVVTAAATLTGRGERPRTYFLQEIRDAKLDQLFETTPRSRTELAAKAAAAALAMQFPEGEPRILTGLSPAKTDVWGVSFGSRHAICVWLGHDKPRKIADQEAAEAALEYTMRRLALSLAR